jgi:parallel beta-helix repeat protein
MKIVMSKLLGAVISVLLVAPCFARTIIVDDNGPAAYKSIQEALTNSWRGDVILVRPGTYHERITFNGRAVTVRSENPDDPGVVQATVITDSAGSTVTFDFNEGDTSVLEGFTITGRGIMCSGTSPTISKNVIRNCEGPGIAGRSAAAPTIIGNTIVANRQEGIYSCNGLIQGNTISQNSAGCAFCSGPIQDNIIIENGPAGGLYYCDGPIVGNLTSGNRAADYGGGFSNCLGEIRNNIIAGNKAGRQGGGLYKCTKSISNNTIVGNVAAEQGGALYQCSGTVRNNIIAFNDAPGGGGIFGPSNSTYNAFWQNNGGNFAEGANAGVGDLVTAPQFARDGRWDTNGTPDKSDDFWVDGDYHLKSQTGRWDPAENWWMLDGVTSYCIDAGNPSSDWSAELWPHGQRINLGVYGGTPQASMSLSDLGDVADLNHDAQVNPADLKRMGQKWPRVESLLAEDLNRDGRVDVTDFAILGQSWRSGPPLMSAPIPNPMTWAVKPYGTGPYTVAMVATTATSTDGTGVEYWFEDFFHPQYNSGWLSFPPGQEPRWQDQDLSPESTYWYRVKARNNGNRMETDWSEYSAAKTLQEDATPPTPNPMTWETEPFRVAAGTIRMVATAATDSSGVEYQFECTSHPAYSSGWQDSRTYEVGPLPKGHYSFKVRARDKSPNHNATGYSKEVSLDLQPPTPDPMKWEIEPREIQMIPGSFGYGAYMKAVEATDDAAGVEYFFECTTESGFSSGWQTSREYTVLVGRRGQYHRFRVKARDTSTGHNETGYSSEVASK